MGARLNNAKALHMEGIRDGNYVEAVNKYTGDRYTQHSAPIEDGREGFKKFFADFTERNIGEDHDSTGDGFTVDLG